MNESPVGKINLSQVHHNPLVRTLLVQIPDYTSALVALVGLTVLAEWLVSTLRIARLGEEFVPMAPATALCFVALGLGSLFQRRSANHPRLRALALGTIILALGSSTVILVEHGFTSISGMSLDIEQWLIPAIDSAQGFVTGRMSPLTASMFILIALACLLPLIARDSVHLRRTAQAFTLATLALAMGFVVSYLYGTPLLYNTRLIPVSLPTAISFAVLGLGLLFEKPNGVLFRLFASHSLSAQFARVAVPGSIMLILAGGWMNAIIWSQARDADRIFGMAIVALATAGLVALLTIVTARQIQSELARYKLLVEHSRDLFLVIRFSDGKFIEANHAALEAYGYSREELLTLTIRDLRATDDVVLVPAQMAQANSTGVLFETIHRRKDGSTFSAEVSSRGVTIGGERVLLSIVRDITQRKHDEAKLRASEEKFSKMFQLAPMLTSLSAIKDGAYLDVNDKFVAVSGFTREEIIGKTSVEMGWLSPAERARIVELLREHGRVSETELTFTTKDRQQIICIFSAELITIDGKQYLLSIGHNITERKHAEQALIEAHTLNESFLRTIPFGMDIVDQDGTILFANEKLSALVGQNMLGKKCWQVYSDDQTQCPNCPLHQPVIIGETKTIQVANALNQRILEIHHTGMQYAGKSALLEIFQDVTERVRAEEQLRVSEAILRKSQAVARLGSYLLDVRTGIWTSSPTLDEIFGIDAAYPKDVAGWLEIVHPTQKAEMQTYFTQHVIAERNPFEKVYCIVRRNDGQSRWVFGLGELEFDADGNPIRMIGTIQDMTERRKQERELQAIAAVSAALRAAHTRAEMLPIILDQVTELLSVQGAAIGLIDGPTGDVVNEQTRGIWHKALGRRTPHGQGISHQVISTGKPYITNDLPNDPLMYWRDLIQSARAMATVPLKTQNDVIGWISIGANSNISEDDLRVLTAIADIAANALHRSALHEQTERHLERITALGMIDRAINASLDLRIVLDILLDQAVTQLNADAAALLLFHRATHTLEWRAERGMRASHLNATPIRLGSDATSRAILERRAIHIADLAAPSDTVVRAPLLAEEGFVSYYAVPLIAKGFVKGVLEIFHRAPHDGDSEWNGFLQSLAEQAAIALDNAELFAGLERANDELILAYDATIEGWSRALDLRDKETEGHTRRVTEMSIRLARALGISDEKLAPMRRGALLHDIGKMGIPDAILLKPGPLDPKEWEIMHLHPAYAHELLAAISYLGNALDIPDCHHEKWDGTGYPRGLAGEAIPFTARIFAIVDVWDALCSDRPYRAAWPPDRVIAYLREQAGKHFDPAIVEPFLNLLNE